MNKSRVTVMYDQGGTTQYDVIEGTDLTMQREGTTVTILCPYRDAVIVTSTSLVKTGMKGINGITYADSSWAVRHTEE